MTTKPEPKSLGLHVVWDTVRVALPQLRAQLPAIREAAAKMDRSAEAGD